MATLRPSVGSTSSLLKTAASVANTVQAIQDKAAADEWSVSGYTDTAYTKYTDYLKGRINSLTSTGTPANTLKAMGLNDTLRTASHQNISSQIAQENIRVMAGQASLTDKYNLISQEFVRAQTNGDETLAQSLMSMAYSVNQQIQYQAQQAGDARATLAKANSTTDAKVAAQSADQALSSLKQLNKDLATVGQKQATGDITKWLNTASPDFHNKTPLQALTDMGIHLPKGAQPNVADIAQGVAAYAYNQYAIASKAVDPYLNPGQNNTYEDKANNIVLGATKISLPGGKSMAYSELGAFSTAIAHGLVGYNETTGGYGKVTAAELASQVTVPGTTFKGYQYDAKSMSVKPVLSSSGFVISSPELAIEANALGLNTAAKSNKDSLVPGAAAQVTSGSPQWLKNIAPVGSWLNVALDGQGQLQFSANSAQKNTPGNSVFTVVKDSTGKRAPIESGSNGDIVLGGEYGFNINNIKLPPGEQDFRNSYLKGNGPHMSLSSDFYGVTNLINTAQQAAYVSAQTLAAAKAMVSLPPVALPPIALPPVVRPPSIAPAPARPSALKPLNVQPGATNVQAVSGPAVQPARNVQSGGNYDVQSGGGGIRL